MGSEPLTAVGGALLRSMQATGIAWRPAADGSWHATLDRVELANVRMPTPFGMADVLKATLTSVEVDARLRPGPAGGAFELRRLAAERADLDDVELTVVLDPSALPSLDRLEPIGGMQGLLRVYIRDATWVIDAVTGPVVPWRPSSSNVAREAARSGRRPMTRWPATAPDRLSRLCDSARSASTRKAVGVPSAPSPSCSSPLSFVRSSMASTSRPPSLASGWPAGLASRACTKPCRSRLPRSLTWPKAPRVS